MASKENVLHITESSLNLKQYSHYTEHYTEVQYNSSEIKKLIYEFEQKEEILKNQAVAMTPLEYFETIFPKGSLEEYGRPETDGKPNGIITILNDSSHRGWNHSRIVFEDRSEVVAVQGAKFAVTSPIGYSGNKRSRKNAYLICGIAIDLDDVGPNELKNLLGQMKHGHLPTSTMLVNSGSGLHVYFVFDKPIPALPQYIKPISRLKHSLSDRIWNQYTSRSSAKQYQGIFQGYRVPGTQSKFSKDCLVAAYRTGEKISIQELDFWVNRLYGDEDHSSGISDTRQHVSLATAKELYPKWYKARIEEGKLAGVYELTNQQKNRRRQWYRAWIERVRSQAVCGRRYFCMAVLFIFAVKAEISYEEALEDALKLVPFLDTLSVAGNPFTEDDVIAAAKFYNPSYSRVGLDMIAQMTGIKIPRTKRNGRNRAAHLKRARLDRDEKYSALGYDWRTKSRDSGIERKVFLYLYRHNGETQKDVRIAAALGVTRQTVAKYRKLYTPEKAEKYLQLESKKVITKAETTPPIDNNILAKAFSFNDKAVARAVAIDRTKTKEVPFEIFFEDVIKKDSLTDEDKKRIEKEDISSLIEVERQVLNLCNRMSERGIRINKRLLEDVCQESQLQMNECANSMAYNPNSTQQIKKHFKNMGISLMNTQLSTLAALRSTATPQIEMEIANLLKYREAHTVYVEGKSILDRIDDTSRVHPVIESLGTITGRLSMSKPNLQGVPSGVIRRCIMPDEGHVMVGADYSQLELRLLANLSKDEFLIKDIISGDPHLATARTIFSVTEPTLEQREMAKTVNYAIVYGMGANSLSAELGITRDEATKLIDNFFDKYKTTKVFLDAVKKDLKSGKYAVSWYGRKRSYPEIIEYHSRRQWTKRNSQIRSAKNYIMQASAADVAKIAMVMLDRAFEINDFKARILLQVHDEIIVSCPREEQQSVTTLMHKIMTDTFTFEDGFEVPLEIKVKAGNNYGDI